MLPLGKVSLIKCGKRIRVGQDQSINKVNGKRRDGVGGSFYLSDITVGWQ